MIYNPLLPLMQKICSYIQAIFRVHVVIDDVAKHWAQNFVRNILAYLYFQRLYIANMLHIISAVLHTHIRVYISCPIHVILIKNLIQLT